MLAISLSTENTAINKAVLKNCLPEVYIPVGRTDKEKEKINR